MKILVTVQSENFPPDLNLVDQQSLSPSLWQKISHAMNSDDYIELTEPEADELQSKNITTLPGTFDATATVWFPE